MRSWEVSISSRYKTNKRDFSFTEVTKDQVRKQILHLDGSKATPVAVGDIPVDILKLTVDVHLGTIKKVISLSLKNCCSPNCLKSAEQKQSSGGVL